MLETHEQSAEIIAVLIDPMVHLFDVWLLEEADHLLFQLTTSFSGNDLHHGDTLVHGLLHDVVERAVNIFSLVEDLVQIEFQFGHGSRAFMGLLRSIPIGKPIAHPMLE